MKIYSNDYLTHWKCWCLVVLKCSIVNCCFQSSAKATDEYELARQKVASFINAGESGEIVFTRNATEAINLVAYTWGLSNLRPQDEVSIGNSCFSSLKF